MAFYADLHIHSRFSRATSPDCRLSELSRWARRKGIAVLGTGDFTHPGWMAEIRESLVPAEPGLFRLRPDLEDDVERSLPASLRSPPPGALPAGPTRFLLEVEISTIYRAAGRTRKVHHLIFMPGIREADEFNRRLARIGNIASDGRPILGLDSRDLLETALESGPGVFLIPAHVWTPWFSVLGSQSGFDAVDECYRDLAGRVFALETGLSSDPLMNWRLSSLDRYRLVSNSDAHSPAKLGREACAFDTPLDYAAMRGALETGKGYSGTVEFFPEEGKYHLDGHRKCQVRCTPEETRNAGGRCPVCGKPVTVGVMHRVADLADREEGAKPAGAAPFRSFIPLAEILGEILDAGADSVRVSSAWNELVSRFGPELAILGHVPLDDLRRACAPLLVEAIRRMREGQVIREAGYDGEYGVIRLFREDERADAPPASRLFDVAAEPVRKSAPRRRVPAPAPATPPPPAPSVREERVLYPSHEPLGILGALDPEQRAAAEITTGPLLLVAGPGAGKTRTLTHRIAHLVADLGVPPGSCLAVTFTNRAAREMTERLQRLLADRAAAVRVTTFHGLGREILREHGARADVRPSFRVADDAEAEAILRRLFGGTRGRARALLDRVRAAKEHPDREEDDIRSTRESYDAELRNLGVLDFTDLLRLPVQILETHADVRQAYQRRWPWISVDEFQDIDDLQFRLIRLLAPPDGNLCAIGDPDQAIYGFRGSDVRYFQRFATDFPSARILRITRNYRSDGAIVQASEQLIRPATLVPDRAMTALRAAASRICIHEAASDRAEAEFVVETIDRFLGGSSFFSLDSGRAEAGSAGGLSFSDFAVLYRVDALSDALCEALNRSGMPFQRRSHVRLGEVAGVAALLRALEGVSGGNLRERFAAAWTRLDPSQAPDAAARDALRERIERCADLDALRADLALETDADLLDPRADRVSLLTLHAAKGLEFKVVFVVGCEDGLLPLRFGDGPASNPDEERRLLFVGMTRARERLFLCRARKRLWQGRLRERRPSPFLLDIEEKLLEYSRSDPTAPRPGPRAEQMPLF